MQSIGRCYPAGGVATSTALNGPPCGSSVRPLRTLPPELLGGLEALFGVPVIETYGMTEGRDPDCRKSLWGDGSSVRSASPQGPRSQSWTARADGFQSGERGEIVLRGPTITRGYDNDDGRQRRPLSRRLVSNRRPRIPRSDGYLFIVGRIKRTSLIGEDRRFARRGRRGVAQPSRCGGSRRFPSTAPAT